jgi:hypothetical protein
MLRLRLVMRCRLLSTSPPGCLLFAGWLSCCISLHRDHLMSPFVMPPPHVSILYPPPSFALAGCHVESRCAACHIHIHRHCHRHLIAPWSPVPLFWLVVASPHHLNHGVNVCGCIIVVCFFAHHLRRSLPSGLRCCCLRCCPLSACSFPICVIVRPPH